MKILMSESLVVILSLKFIASKLWQRVRAIDSDCAIE